MTSLNTIFSTRAARQGFPDLFESVDWRLPLGYELNSNQLGILTSNFQGFLQHCVLKQLKSLVSLFSIMCGPDPKLRLSGYQYIAWPPKSAKRREYDIRFIETLQNSISPLDFAIDFVLLIRSYTTGSSSRLGTLMHFGDIILDMPRHLLIAQSLPADYSTNTQQQLVSNSNTQIQSENQVSIPTLSRTQKRTIRHNITTSLELGWLRQISTPLQPLHLSVSPSLGFDLADDWTLGRSQIVLYCLATMPNSEILIHEWPDVCAFYINGHFLSVPSNCTAPIFISTLCVSKHNSLQISSHGLTASHRYILTIVEAKNANEEEIIQAIIGDRTIPPVVARQCVLGSFGHSDLTKKSISFADVDTAEKIARGIHPACRISLSKQKDKTTTNRPSKRARIEEISGSSTSLSTDTRTSVTATTHTNQKEITSDTLQTKIQENESDSDDVVEIQTDSTQISIRDPVSLMPIRIPARGRNCKHLRVFDLLSYLQLNRASRPRWTCPICHKRLTPKDICLDTFFYAVLYLVANGHNSGELNTTLTVIRNPNPTLLKENPTLSTLWDMSILMKHTKKDLFGNDTSLQPSSQPTMAQEQPTTSMHPSSQSTMAQEPTTSSMQPSQCTMSQEPTTSIQPSQTIVSQATASIQSSSMQPSQTTVSQETTTSMQPFQPPMAQASTASIQSSSIQLSQTTSCADLIKMPQLDMKPLNQTDIQKYGIIIPENRLEEIDSIELSSDGQWHVKVKAGIRSPVNSSRTTMTSMGTTKDTSSGSNSQSIDTLPVSNDTTTNEETNPSEENVIELLSSDEEDDEHDTRHEIVQTSIPNHETVPSAMFNNGLEHIGRSITSGTMTTPTSSNPMGTNATINMASFDAHGTTENTSMNSMNAHHGTIENASMNSMNAHHGTTENSRNASNIPVGTSGMDVSRNNVISRAEPSSVSNLMCTPLMAMTDSAQAAYPGVVNRSLLPTAMTEISDADTLDLSAYVSNWNSFFNGFDVNNPFSTPWNRYDE